VALLRFFFAFASALNYATSYFAPIYHWELDAKILGFEWGVLGIVLFLQLRFLLGMCRRLQLYPSWGPLWHRSLVLIYFGYKWCTHASAKRVGFFVAGLFGIVMAAGESYRVLACHFQWVSRCFKQAA